MTEPVGMPPVKSLPEVLGELPDGGGSSIGWDLTLKWLRDRYLDPTCYETDRIKSAQERHDFYRDRGSKYIEQLIDKVYDDPEVKKLRNEWVEQAGYNNVTRRVVHELATLYRRPARRHVDDDAENLKYQQVLQLVSMDSTMLEVQRLAILHRALMVMVRVQSWSGMPVLDIIEPQCFRLVTHPNDPRRLIAVIIDQVIESPALKREDWPAYLVWTAAERFRLSSAGNMVGEPKAHTFGRIPGVLVSVSPPPGRIIDDSTFSDVIRAHRAVWFENVNLLKESKSGTKTNVLTGNLSSAMRKQMLDSEGAIQLPDGVQLTPTDMTVDLAPYRETADHIIERAAANHGIPPAVLRGEGASSGYEIELRYVGIRERRIEQEPYFRNVERELAETMSIVLGADNPEFAFKTDGWSIDFGEVQMPLTRKEELEIFEAERRLGLTDTIEQEQKRNPDLDGDDEGTWAVLAKRVDNETRRNELMRPLQQISGSMGAEQPVAEERPMGATGDEARPRLEVAA